MHIPYDEIDDNRVTTEEVETLLREGEKLAPIMGRTRVLRAYSGIRPLVASDDDPSGRSVSRGIVLLDHARRDGMEGFITITGGKPSTATAIAPRHGLAIAASAVAWSANARRSLPEK